MTAAQWGTLAAALVAFLTAITAQLSANRAHSTVAAQQQALDSHLSDVKGSFVNGVWTAPGQTGTPDAKV